MYSAHILFPYFITVMYTKSASHIYYNHYGKKLLSACILGYPSLSILNTALSIALAWPISYHCEQFRQTSMYSKYPYIMHLLVACDIEEES